MPDSPAPARLFLIDAPGFVFRAFHALPPLSTADGTPTGAVHGFCNMLLKLLDEQRPEYLAAVFDRGPSFRQALFADYKAHRPPTPPELSRQFPLVRELLTAFRVPVIEAEGLEADDLIATLTREARRRGFDVVIVSSDKDLMQLVDEQVRLLDTMKDKLYGVAEVVARYGVVPAQLGDWLALVGDTSDNVPGVPGIGAKTASKLLGQWGSLEGVLAAADQAAGKKLQQALREHAELARLSRRLVALREDCPLALGVEALKCQAPDKAALGALVERLELGRLRQRLAAADALAAEAVPTDAAAAEAVPTDAAAAEAVPTNAAAPEAGVVAAPQALVLSMAELEGLLARATASGRLALSFDLEPDQRPSQAQVLGLGLCVDPETAAYVPVGHLFLGAPRQLAWAQVTAALAPLLADSGIVKYIHDVKLATTVLGRAGLPLCGVADDPMLASYLLDPSRPTHDLGALARLYLRQDLALPSGAGRRGAVDGEATLRESARSVAAAAVATWEVTSRLGVELARDPPLSRLMREVERPLSDILAAMELRGCLVEARELRAIGEEVALELRQLERAIQEQAGWAININSPKQLRSLLFDQLGLTAGKKTKTGYSTDSEVLADLALEHPIAGQIEAYRTLHKIKSGWLDALPALIDPGSGRVHTRYNQAVAATGRLSSSDPNLQNIPIRGPLGRRIRRAFTAPPGCVLLSGDYSQVELRVLAHLSQDPVLVDAFRRGQDVHRRTAAEVFGVAPEDVSEEQRRVAKAVNFGVIYGQSDWGLSRQLHLPRAVARRYIDDYFARYAGVQTFMERIVAEARATGEVRTLLGRRRPVPGLTVGSFAARAAAERIARNTPIQGTAADLIKLAMIRVEGALRAAGLEAPMILSVHDELVFEVREGEVEAVAALVREAMAQVAVLDVPLQVDVGYGPSWGDAH
ncbi:MAG: DNA polymerase I [Proteobacteria bacterium]|nr:DNA polymerase I [Pseudomonadota bacterium]